MDNDLLSAIGSLIEDIDGLVPDRFPDEDRALFRWDNPNEMMNMETRPNWPVFYHREPEITREEGITDIARTVTLYLVGSHKQPNPKWLLDFPSVQIRIRGQAGRGGATALRAAQLIKDRLLGVKSLDFPTIRLVSVTMASDIMTLGKDESECMLFTMNFNCIVEPHVGDFTPPSNREPLSTNPQT